MSSIRLGGVRFVAYSNDHLPRHVHAFFAEIEVVIDLLNDGNVTLANRRDCIRPRNAKRSDVRRILDIAALHFEELLHLWEKQDAKA
jgi:hypothetical protein